MWLGGAFQNYLKLRIRVYVDHESTSSIDAELGLGAGVGFGDSHAPWGTQFSGITGSPSGVFLNYRIPFRSHIRVTAELPSGVSRETGGLFGVPRTSLCGCQGYVCLRRRDSGYTRPKTF